MTASRKQATHRVQFALRELGPGIERVSGAVGSVVGLTTTDLAILDLIGRAGPVSPGALAETVGVHPATMTGILDRLEEGGWIARERSTEDRRKVHLRALRSRGPELVRLYRPMNDAIAGICAKLDVEQLETVASFLEAVGAAARDAASEIGDVARG